MVHALSMIRSGVNLRALFLLHAKLFKAGNHGDRAVGTPRTKHIEQESRVPWWQYNVVKIVQFQLTQFLNNEVRSLTRKICVRIVDKIALEASVLRGHEGMHISTT